MPWPPIILALLLTVSFAAAAVAQPKWIYCYNRCINALEKAEPQPPENCHGLSGDQLSRCDAEVIAEELVKIIERQKGDGGKAFEKFKLCNSLCK